MSSLNMLLQILSTIHALFLKKHSEQDIHTCITAGHRRIANYFRIFLCCLVDLNILQSIYQLTLNDTSPYVSPVLGLFKGKK